MKQTLTLTAAIALIFAAASCGSDSHTDSTEAEIEASAAAGRRDAIKALGEPTGTMQREAAIFAIRARETRLRHAGHPSCADAYATAAAALLTDSLAIPSTL